MKNNTKVKAKPKKKVGIASRIEIKQMNKDRAFWYQVCDLLEATLYGWTYQSSATLTDIKTGARYEVNAILANKIIELDLRNKFYNS